MNNKLYVGNLPSHLRTEQLRGNLYRLFENYGNIEKVFVVKNSPGGRTKAFGFVTFESAKAAKKALAEDGVRMKGRPLRVSFAKEKGTSGEEQTESFFTKLLKILRFKK